jgi:hypothetical protein
MIIRWLLSIDTKRKIETLQFSGSAFNEIERQQNNAIFQVWNENSQHSKYWESFHSNAKPLQTNMLMFLRQCATYVKQKVRKMFHWINLFGGGIQKFETR